ncbi:MAG: phosphoribosylanthranilate isomerase [Crocinitomicaceae bacterium]|nr:phosphoribosylanthranilate isomerase [Crocinitomicaceae bacterium]
MILKVCGLNDVENIRTVEGMKGVTHTGFIFVQNSPRNALSLIEIPEKREGVKRVGVFMNPEVKEVILCAKRFHLDIVQLHGDEAPELCSEISAFAEVWKAIGIASADDFAKIDQYLPFCTAFVLDKKTPLGGGSGEQYNWQLLSNYQFHIPFLLSGGIAATDAARLAALKHNKCVGYDINSRFEVSPGIKDARAINLFIEQLEQNK